MNEKGTEDGARRSGERDHREEVPVDLLEAPIREAACQSDRQDKGERSSHCGVIGYGKVEDEDRDDERASADSKAATGKAGEQTKRGECEKVHSQEIGRRIAQVEPGEPLFVVGSTGVGKTELAHALAERSGAWILSMDSMQVYRRLDLGTAKPSLEERARFSYGGLDLVDWRVPFSVAQYREHARMFLESCQSRERPAIVVGGAGLYYRSMIQGLCEAPPGNVAIRQELAALSVPELARRLAEVDPKAASNIDLRNPRRLIRAIEVKEETGVSLLDWQKRTTRPLLRRSRTLWVERTEEDLRSRIAVRVRAMLASGWVEEVEDRLREAGPGPLFGCPAIGYAQIAQFLLRGGSRAMLEEAIVRDTYQYARKQLTWFRKESSIHYHLVLEEHGPFPWRL